MSVQSISRKNFLKNSSILLVGSNMFLNRQSESAGQIHYSSNAKTITVNNVRLETGFEYKDDEISNTKTELFTIELLDGKIKNVLPNHPGTKGIDAKGWLMLPAFKDMHIHLDKTFYGGPWKAPSKKNRTVKDMIAYD